MTRLVEVSRQRYPAWRERFDAANAHLSDPQRVVAVDTFDADPLGVVLVRRGGYAVGLAKGAELVSHKVGTRYVQSRTKKGGWSQQRYARRRGNQADELVGAAAEHAVRIVVEGLRDRSGAGLVLGGDRALAAVLLEDPRLAPLRGLPRRELYDLPDPRLDVLRTAVARGRAVRVTIADP